MKTAQVGENVKTDLTAHGRWDNSSFLLEEISPSSHLGSRKWLVRAGEYCGEQNWEGLHLVTKNDKNLHLNKLLEMLSCLFSWWWDILNENSVCWLQNNTLSNWSIMCHCTLKCQSLHCWDNCSHLLWVVAHRRHHERSKNRLKLFSADAHWCSGNKGDLCSSYLINQGSHHRSIYSVTGYSLENL